jgi:hypothetical protein
MATDSSTKLTKFVRSQTIVTADFANAMYGGLYGTTEGDALDADDPRVAGHVHDGENADGHSQKVHLVNHVTDQLTNSNLADDAVTKRNVASFTDASDAIPESEVIDGTTYYYLDIDQPIGYSTLQLSADGGSVSGDGAGDIEADSSEDTVNIKAGSGIDILTDLTNDSLTISSTAQSFGIVAMGATSGETGQFSGTGPLESDLARDTVTLEAGYGMDITGDASGDIVKFRAQHSMTYQLLGLDAWVNGNSPAGWGTVQTRHYTDGGGSDLSYTYQIVADDDYVYATVPIPENAFGDRPDKVVFKSYFIAADQGTAYLAALNPDPTFTISLEIGSNETQADNVDKGTIEDDQDITASGMNLWTTGIAVASTAVTGPNRYYILTWPEQTLGKSGVGLLSIRMTGTTGFSSGIGDFDNGTNRGRAEFIKAELTWYY